MRGQFRDVRDRLVAAHGDEALKSRTPSTERFQVEMYLDYWYAAIFAAVDGYEKLALTDPEVERLRNDPLYTKLRSYRAGVYHFGKNILMMLSESFFNRQIPRLG